MSACIQVTQNPDGTWTAKGGYAGVFAAVSKALYAFEPLARS